MVLEGLRYIWRNKLVLGSISLDLFAVLLGGAVALLPVYRQRNPAHRRVRSRSPAQRTRSGSGPDGASSWPTRRCAATPVSTMLVLRLRIRRLHDRLRPLAQPGSLACRARSARRLRYGERLRPPDPGATCHAGRHARPRQRRQLVFIGASNEVGQFESGLTAQWFGTVPAVVLGGLGTIASRLAMVLALPVAAPRG